MTDTQTMLDRGHSVAEIRRMCAAYRTQFSPRQRVGLQIGALLAKAPVLDACNHAR